MKSLLFIFCFVLAAFSANAEYGEILRARTMEYSRQNQIDTFVIYSYPYYGGYPIDTCYNEEPHYLFWLKKSRYYLKRFDYCKSYDVIEVGRRNPLQFYKEHKQRVDTENIYRPGFITRDQDGNETISQMVMDHCQVHTFYFSTPTRDDMKMIVVNTDYLEMKECSDARNEKTRANFWYRYNQSTQIKQLADLTDALIERLKAQGRFHPLIQPKK